MTSTHIAERLTEARARTLMLISSVSDEDLRRQHDPLMGPIIWDIGHIAHFEELWLLDNLRGDIRFGEMPGMYNPFEYPRSVRGELDLPDRCTMLAELADVRARVLRALEGADLSVTAPRLLRDGFVYNMVLQHEYQHNETMLQTLQLKQGEPYTAPRAFAFAPPAVSLEPGRTVRFPGGRVPIGTADESAAYDNERPQHTVELAPFLIDMTPVTNGEYAEFIDAGGYQRRELWSDAGWHWLQDGQVQAPRYWQQSGTGWRVRSFDREAAVDLRAAVCHVCYHEAEAYATWAEKRLPTEAEWEAAATWDPATDTKRVYPWGDDDPTQLTANVDQLAFGTAPIGTYARNTSPIGCYGMIGDVWEWTSSYFSGYPGHVTFPYAEYSEVFFGTDYRVLRGGSWATRPGATRGTFRNWDYPIRRQIFSGFRCVRDDR